MELTLVYSWNDAKRRWRVSCREHPAAQAAGVSPRNAKRAILKTLVGILGPNPDAVSFQEVWELPEPCRAQQERYLQQRSAISALTTSVVALEVDLALSLRRMRLPISQIATLLAMPPQRADAILQLQALASNAATDGRDGECFEAS